jgi:ribokinase
MDNAHIISLGSINVDFQMRAHQRPESGETLLAEDFLMAGGGKAANVAFIARRLGVDACLLARVGDDVLAEEALSPLRRVGVDLTLTRPVAGQSTGAAFIFVQPDGEKRIILAANANQAWIPDDLDEIAAAIYQAPLGSVLVADLEVSDDIVTAALLTARHCGLPTVLDPSPAERMKLDLFPLIDYLTPNPAETEQLTGIEIQSPEDGVRAGCALLRFGVGTALIKLRGGGCVVIGREIQESVPAPRVDVVDKTGAGDAFAGALAVALLQGRSRRDGEPGSVAAATLAVTRYGSQASYPDETEVERLLSAEGSER